MSPEQITVLITGALEAKSYHDKLGNKEVSAVYEKFLIGLYTYLAIEEIPTPEPYFFDLDLTVDKLKELASFCSKTYEPHLTTAIKIIKGVMTKGQSKLA